jgi:hypothetical protein
MTPQILKTHLNTGRLNKERIEGLVQELLIRPELTESLLEEVFAQDAARDSFNASWVFDHLMRKKLDFLLPHIDRFIEGTAKLKTESCMRPMAHVMELLNEAYFLQRKPTYLKCISKDHHETMVTICFDWLINEHKVATKVFAMTSLYYLGERFEWVGPELKSVLELQIADGTAGFKNRGGKILNKLKNLGY